jgi:phage terminase large subunit GpA-like protein
VQLWPVGTHSLKLAHYAAIRRTIRGPDETGAQSRGLLLLPGAVDEDYCRQLTAEFLYQPAKGNPEWRVITGTRNERLDTAVYARALAHHLTDSLTPAQWQAVLAARAVDTAASQADLSAYWSERFGTDAPPVAPAPAPPTAPATASLPPAFIPRRSGWLQPGRFRL